MGRSAIGHGRRTTGTPAPPNVVATLISQTVINITTADSGVIATISILDGLPQVFTAIEDGGANAGLTTVAMVSDTTFTVTLASPQSAGTYTIWVKATNAAGQSGELGPISIVVADPAFASPTDPFSGNAITLSGGFPATVTASNVAGIDVDDAFASWTALTTALIAAGGDISVTVPSGTHMVAGGFPDGLSGMSLISPKGTFAPFAANKGPTSYLDAASVSGSGISTGATHTNANARFFVQGFVIGTPHARLNEDQAFPFSNGGTYEIQAGDNLVGGSVASYNSGGTYVMAVGNVITGASSGATGTIMVRTITSGTDAAGTAAGKLTIGGVTGTFTSGENLNVGANLNVATITTAFTVPITATAVSVILDSGSWAAGTAAGGLVLKSRTGAYPEPDYLSVGANLNVATITDNLVQYGPRALRCVNAVKHYGQGAMELVSCYMRNAVNDVVGAAPTIDVDNITPTIDMYDCMVELGGTDNLKHNMYIHRQKRVGFVRSASINPRGGGHALKSDNFKTIVLDSFLARDHGNLEGIVDDVITVGTGTQTLTLDGNLCAGGVATLTETADLGYPLVRAFSTGNMSGRWLNLTGTNAADAVITDQIKLADSGPAWSALRFKTVTAATITNVAGAAVVTGQRLYVGIGLGDPSEGQAVIDYSRAQDMRVARSLFHQRSMGNSTGGKTISVAARTSTFGGVSSKTPPLCDISGYFTQGAADMKTPFESNAYNGQVSLNNYAAQCTTAIGAAATTIVLKRINRFPEDASLVTLSTASAYRVRILRVDGTIGEFTATPSVAASGTATIPLGGAVGGGGVNVNANVAVQLSTTVDDNLAFTSRWYNQADTNYFFGTGARGIATAGGVLDLTKQPNFDTHYFEDNFVCQDYTLVRSMLSPGQEGQHFTWCSAASGFLIEAPLPPGNRAQGQWSVAFTSGGTYTPVVGDACTGATSGATATIGGVRLVTGSWAAGTAAGILYFTAKSGTFQAENVDITGHANAFTIAGDIPQDWPDVADAATLTGLLAGWGIGTQCVGVVDGDTFGSVCDWIWPWPEFFKNIPWHNSTRSTGTFSQVGGMNAPQISIAKLNLIPDLRQVTAGALVSCGSSNNPFPTPAMATLATAAAGSADKLYLSTTTGFAVGERIFGTLPLQPGANEAIYIGTIQTVSSDGGGAFVTVSPILPRAMSVGAEVSAIPDAGADPANWITPSQYWIL